MQNAAETDSAKASNCQEVRFSYAAITTTMDNE